MGVWERIPLDTMELTRMVLYHSEPIFIRMTSSRTESAGTIELSKGLISQKLLYQSRKPAGFRS
jgi:hypothetical protein